MPHSSAPGTKRTCRLHRSVPHLVACKRGCTACEAACVVRTPLVSICHLYHVAVLSTLRHDGNSLQRGAAIHHDAKGTQGTHEEGFKQVDVDLKERWLEAKSALDNVIATAEHFQQRHLSDCRRWHPLLVQLRGTEVCQLHCNLEATWERPCSSDERELGDLTQDNLAWCFLDVSCGIVGALDVVCTPEGGTSSAPRCRPFRCRAPCTPCHMSPHPALLSFGSGRGS